MGWQKRNVDPGFEWTGWHCAHCCARKSGDYSWEQGGREFCNETCAAFYEVERRGKRKA